MHVYVNKIMIMCWQCEMKFEGLSSCDPFEVENDIIENKSWK